MIAHVDLWIWGIAAAVSLGVVAVYWRGFAGRASIDEGRLQEARKLGFDRPTGQYPHIDPRLCIGCGACVEACPEGDVLGMVGGQATVVNGLRCIGIAACEPACPVGAVTVGLGEVKGRGDLPILDEDRESTVEGIFIAGELGGLSLVRNAIEQGRRTTMAIARRCRSSTPTSQAHDLVIVGSGPAGLSAALTAVELGLDYVVLEQASDFGGTIFHYPRRKLVHTQPVEIPLHGTLSAGEHSKEDLLELFESLRSQHRLEIAFGQRLIGVERENGRFRVLTANDCFHARFVLLALGRRGTPRHLDVPGEELPKVMYQVRDAALYRGQRLLCVGGGDSAVEAAMGLGSQPGNQVLLSYRRERFGRIKKRNQELLDEAVAAGHVQPLLPSNLLEIRESQVRLEVAGQERLFDNDFVFILAGGIPPFAMLKEMGIRFGDDLE